MIPYGRQSISEADIEAVVSVLRSDFITQGPALPRFEQAVAAYCGASYGVATNSATSALHLACLALDVGPGDLVWTSPISFVASANCARFCGADIDFVDIDAATFNMDPEKLAEKLEHARKSGGRLPKVVIPVHLAGQPSDLCAISKLSEEYGFRVIEDAAHALGGRYRGSAIGSCEHSDITIFSFHPVKLLTTGEGGMAITNRTDLAERMESLRSHGITREPSRMTRTPDGPWYYQQLELGFNYRMTDIQAALGYSQLQRLDAFLQKRVQLAGQYDTAFTDSGIRFQERQADSQSAHHLYIVRVPRSLHEKVFTAMREQGINVNLHYIPVYLQPYYQQLGFVAGHCPEAEQYYSEAVSLPIFPDLSSGQQDQVILALKTMLDQG